MKHNFLLIALMVLLGCSKSNESTVSSVAPTAGPTQNPSNNNSDDSSNTVVEAVSFELFETKFKSLMTRLNMPGAQVAITKNEKLVYLKSFGLADRSSNEMVNDGSLFRIASISKPITALAILKLVSENKLALTDKVFGAGAILGTEYGSLEYSSREEQITVLNLLEHKSGFTNNPYDIMFDDISLSQKNLIDTVLDTRDLSSSPGGSYYYSNFGYCVLGRIIEKISGMGYEEYVIEELLNPMGIDNMRIGGNTLDEKYENEVTYTSSWFDPYQMNVSRMDSHGGWIASAKELVNIAVRADTRPVVKDLLDFGDMELYFENGNWGHNGALPGTSTIINVGQIYSFAVVFNGGSSNFESEQSQTSSLLIEEVFTRTKWPNIDLFD